MIGSLTGILPASGLRPSNAWTSGFLRSLWIPWRAQKAVTSAASARASKLDFSPPKMAQRGVLPSKMRHRWSEWVVRRAQLHTEIVKRCAGRLPLVAIESDPPWSQPSALDQLRPQRTDVSEFRRDAGAGVPMQSRVHRAPEVASGHADERERYAKVSRPDQFRQRQKG